MSELLHKQRSHVLLGANNSFQPQSDHEWNHWDAIINSLLVAGISVSLEIEHEYQDKIQDHAFVNHDEFYLLTNKLI